MRRGRKGGKVLVAGGKTALGPTASAWLYDPDIGVWHPTGAMSTARSSHVAAVLRDGRVLVAGGGGAGSVSGSRARRSTTRLPARGRPPGASRPPGTTPLRPCSGRGSSAGASTPTDRRPSTTRSPALLPTGTLVVAGGSGPTATVELYDPGSNAWSSTLPLAAARMYLRAVVLPDARVLVGPGWQGARQC